MNDVISGSHKQSLGVTTREYTAMHVLPTKFFKPNVTGYILFGNFQGTKFSKMGLRITGHLVNIDKNGTKHLLHS